MLIIIIAALLVLGIAFFQSVQGMYSAVIMALLTLASAVIAFNYYEVLAQSLHESQPAYADAIAIIATFVIPLLALRIIADMGLRGNALFGNSITVVWISRVVAGTVGLFTGIVTVGVLMIAVQMLPFRPSILGYSPYDGAFNRDAALAPFYPDRFTIGMVDMLSTGSLAGEQSFAKVHDDLVLETFCNRNTAGKLGRTEAPADSLKVLSADRGTTIESSSKFAIGDHERGDLPKDGMVLRVAVAVDRSACDEDGMWRLPATQFRLVGASGKSYYPVNGRMVGFLDKAGSLFYKAATTTAPSNKEPTEEIDPPLSTKHEKTPDWFRLAAYAKSEARSVAGGEAVEPAAFEVYWYYFVDPKDAPDYMVFRRIAKVAVQFNEGD